MAVTGCHADNKQPSRDDSITGNVSPNTDANLQIKADQLWDKALYDLRSKVADHKAVNLLVAKNVCLYWPALSGYDTVVKNPSIYSITQGTEQLSFMPFVPSEPPGRDLAVMNGPYVYNDSAKNIDNFGNMGAVVFTGDFELFTSKESTYDLHQVKQPSPFTPGWLQAADGTHISETEIIADTNLQQAFDSSCHLESAVPTT